MKVDLRNVKYELVEIINKEECFIDVMDIEVDDTHYYTLENGIVSHNSVSILTQTTSGIEPLFKMDYKRRKKVNPNDEGVRIDVIDAVGDAWQEFIVYHPKVKEWMDATGETDLTKAPWYGCCAEDINWQNRVKLQAAANRHVDHSISSCLSPNSLIETNNGLLYMDEIFDFDKLEEGKFCKNEKNIEVLNHEIKSVKIDEFYNNGEKHVLTMVLINGLKISCTYNEKFIVLDDKNGTEKWKELSEIKKGDRIKVKNIDHT